MITALTEALGVGPVVLDGGLATQLESQGHNLDSALWSARLLRDDPDAIVQAHLAYFTAGAQVATTASYQASLGGFAQAGISQAEAEQLIRRSVRLAEQARASMQDGNDRWIAGSVGPYGAALADGSEYRGDYNLSVDELRAWHRPRIALLAEAGADILALETIPCLAEVEALLAEVDGSRQPCWLSITCLRDRTRAGEPAAEAFSLARGVEEIVAVGSQLHRPGRRVLAGLQRQRIEWQAGRCLSQQRGTLGPSNPDLDRPEGLPAQGCDGLDQRRRGPRRWVLPRRAGGSPGDW